MKRDAAYKGDDKPIHLTPEGITRLRERLAHLKKKLPDYIAEVQRTAAYGDRSDNAEYKQAKGTLRRTHWLIFKIEDELKRVVPITLGKHISGTVQLGSTVVVESKEGKKKTFEIVGPYETDPDAGRISDQSPLGAALINKKQGDTVVIETLRGTEEYRIIEIK